MDRKVRAEFDEMREAHRRAMERMDKADARAAENHQRALERMQLAEKRMGLAGKRMDKAEAREAKDHGRAMERMDRAIERLELAEKRMEKFDQQLQATRKLVIAGMKIVSHLAADTRELKRSQKAFLDSLRHAGNSRRHLA
jgi:hypothetical protein